MTKTVVMNAPLQKHASAGASSAPNVEVGGCVGPLRGLRYQEPSVAGAAVGQGELHYNNGETVSPLRGDLVLRAVGGALRLNLAQPANLVVGDVDKLRNRLITYISRLVHSSWHGRRRPNHRRS